MLSLYRVQGLLSLFYSSVGQTDKEEDIAGKITVIGKLLEDGFLGWSCSDRLPMRNDTHTLALTHTHTTTENVREGETETGTAK